MGFGLDRQEGERLMIGQEGSIMHQQRRIHDGIVGAVVTAGVALGYSVDPLWLLVPGVLGVTLIQSGLTGFCPLYYLLGKIGPTELPTAATRPGVK